MDSKKKGLGFVKYIILLLALFLLGNSIVICRANEYKLIRQFGRVQRVVSCLLYTSRLYPGEFSRNQRRCVSGKHESQFPFLKGSERGKDRLDRSCLLYTSRCV